MRRNRLVVMVWLGAGDRTAGACGPQLGFSTDPRILTLSGDGAARASGASFSPL